MIFQLLIWLYVGCVFGYFMESLKTLPLKKAIKKAITTSLLWPYYVYKYLKRRE